MIRSANPPLIIGHRGAAGVLPENTMESFRLAFEQGAAMIEFDAHTSRDGAPIILHDAKLDRTTNGKGYASHFTLQELKQFDAGRGFRIPSLEEMLQEFKTQGLCVEIKENSAELTHKVAKLLQKYKAEARAVVGSKYWIVSKTMKDHYPQIRRFLSKREFVLMYLDYKSGGKKIIKDPQAVASMPLEACGLDLSRADFIQYLHARGIKVFYWTINDLNIMKELIQRGADGIITDFPGTVPKAV